jgi:hypothetical protein
MRTKTLLLSAVALAAGLIPALAQPVFSVNVVGYYNITVPGNKFAMIGNQLPSGPNGLDSAVNSVYTNGVPDASVMFIWNGTGYDTIQYFLGFGWFDQNFNAATNALPPGIGSFLQNGSSGPATITLVGQVPQGGFTNKVTLGFGDYSLPTSVATNIDSSIMNFPSADQDLYFHWNVAQQQFDNPFQFFAGFGWFDQNFVQVFPTPNVGEGFFYQHAGGTSNWIANFTVP